MPDKRHLFLFAALVALASCADTTGPPDPGDGTGPTILKRVAPAGSINFSIAAQGGAFSESGPGIDKHSFSFWVVKSVPNVANIRYVSADGTPTSTFMSMDFPANALKHFPDGSKIEKGDSVLITVNVDPSLFLVRLEPSGLEFDGKHPVKLTIWYDELGDDLNQDGVVDTVDEDILSGLGVWYQENEGRPWSIQSSDNTPGSRTVRTELKHFSNYAVGY